MSKNYSGIFSLQGGKTVSPAEPINKKTAPQTDRYHKTKIPISDLKSSEPTEPTHVIRNAAGQETPVYGLNDPKAKSITAKKGYSVSSLKNYTNPITGAQVKVGQVIKKENEAVAKAVAKELSEAWWCGTPEVMEKERAKKSSFTHNQPKGADVPNMDSDDKMALEAVVEAAKMKSGKATKAKTRPTKPSRVKPAANEDPAMEHARQIVKMAKAVSASVYSGPLDILAAAYAKHTFHPDKIGETQTPEDTYIDEGLWGDIKAKVRDALGPKIKVTKEGPVTTKKGTSSEKAVNMGAGKAYKMSQLAQQQAGFLSDTTAKHAYGSKLPNTDIAKSYGELERHPEKVASAPPKTYSALQKAFSGNKPIQPGHRANPSTHLAGTAPVANPDREAQAFHNRFTASVPYQSLSKEQRKRHDIGEAKAIVNKFLEDTMTGDVASMALGFAPTGEMDPHEGRPGKKKKKKGQFQELAREVSGKHEMTITPYHKLARIVASNMSGV